ncbi:hypothetical protein ACKI2N_032235 [Cupriavidus sp. 30B13]
MHVVEWDGGRLLVAASAAGNVTVLQTCPPTGMDGVPDAALAEPEAADQ